MENTNPKYAVLPNGVTITKTYKTIGYGEDVKITFSNTLSCGFGIFTGGEEPEYDITYWLSDKTISDHLLAYQAAQEKCAVLLPNLEKMITPIAQKKILLYQTDLRKSDNALRQQIQSLPDEY